MKRKKGRIGPKQLTQNQVIPTGKFTITKEVYKHYVFAKQKQMFVGVQHQLHISFG